GRIQLFFGDTGMRGQFIALSRGCGEFRSQRLLIFSVNGFALSRRWNKLAERLRVRPADSLLPLRQSFLENPAPVGCIGLLRGADAGAIRVRLEILVEYAQPVEALLRARQRAGYPGQFGHSGLNQ